MVKWETVIESKHKHLILIWHLLPSCSNYLTVYTISMVQDSNFIYCCISTSSNYGQRPHELPQLCLWLCQVTTAFQLCSGCYIYSDHTDSSEKSGFCKCLSQNWFHKTKICVYIMRLSLWQNGVCQVFLHTRVKGWALTINYIIREVYEHVWMYDPLARIMQALNEDLTTVTQKV